MATIFFLGLFGALSAGQSTSPIRASSKDNGVPPSMPKSGGPVILEKPLDKMRTRANDPEKVKELMESIIGLQEPIDVLEVDRVYYDLKLIDALVQKPVAKFVLVP